MDRTRKILHLLEKHREGLTTQEVAKGVGVSRITIACDLNGLVGSGKVTRRRVSHARIYYLKEGKP